MKDYLINLAISQIDVLAGFFEGQDEDHEGRDDRIARILKNASDEIKLYRTERRQQSKS